MSAQHELQQLFLEVAYLKDPHLYPDYIVATLINKEPDDQVLGLLGRLWEEKYAGVKVDALLPIPEAAKKFAPTFGQATGISFIAESRKLKDGEEVPAGAITYRTESFTHENKQAVTVIEGLTEGMTVGILDDVVDDASTFEALMQALNDAKINVAFMTVIFDKRHKGGAKKIEKAGVDFFSAIPVEIVNGLIQLAA